MANKPKLAFYWASSCGGCEISLVNVHEAILDVAAAFDLVFCPCLVDTKKKDVEAMPDQSIEICFFNGAIRTDENEEMAHLLSRKARVLIAYGACAYGGGIPALANLHSRSDMLTNLFLENPTIDNPGHTLPQAETKVPEGVLQLSPLRSAVASLRDVVEVDFFFPGCPPESKQLVQFIQFVIDKQPLPVKGSVVGAGKKAVCDECERKKEDKCVPGFVRNYEIVPDTEKCLLEQGLLCMGIATRGGCEALCPKANMPCIGCYGPPEGVVDQGAKMAGALGGMLDISDLKELPEGDIPARIQEKIRAIPDFSGTAYKFHLAESLLKRAMPRKT